MPLLARAKVRVAKAIGSDALRGGRVRVDLLRLAYDVNDETELEYLEINPNRTVHTPVLGWKT